MKKEFTPGPWVACTDEGWEGVVHSPEGRTVATCPWDERAKADARLIAQAPALLEALEQLLNECDSRFDYTEATDEEIEAMEAARAAIAQATGDKE